MLTVSLYVDGALVRRHRTTNEALFERSMIVRAELITDAMFALIDGATDVRVETSIYCSVHNVERMLTLDTEHIINILEEGAP